MDQPLQLGLATPDGHLQGVQGQVGAERPGGLPADQVAAEGVDDQGHIDKAGPGRHIGQISDPQLIGSLRGGVPLHQVGWPRGARIRRGGPLGLATADAFQAQLAHRPLHRAAGHRDPLAVQLAPDLAGAVDAEVLGMDAADLRLELAVAHGSGRGGSACGLVVGGQGDRQHPTDRLDPKSVLVTVE
jgi:hypothetical protein